MEALNKATVTFIAACNKTKKILNKSQCRKFCFFYNNLAFRKTAFGLKHRIRLLFNTTRFETKADPRPINLYSIDLVYIHVTESNLNQNKYTTLNSLKLRCIRNCNSRTF